MISVPLTEANNQNFVRVNPPRYIFFKHVLGLPMQSNKGGATEDNNRNFARGSPTNFLTISLVDVVSVLLTEANNHNFARGFLT